MGLRREGKIRYFAPAQDFLVVALIIPDGHALVGNIGYIAQEITKGGIKPRDPLIQFGNEFAHRANLGLPLRCILSSFPEFADLSRRLVPLRLQAFSFRYILAAFGVQLAELIDVERVAACSQPIPNGIEIAPEKVKIVHSRGSESSGESLSDSRRWNASLTLGDWHPFLPVRSTRIVRPRTNQTIVSILLEDVGGPTGHAAHGKDRCE